MGWDKFQTRKYPHQFALTMLLAAWFAAETRLAWVQRFAQYPVLLAKSEFEGLPQFSVANGRELLRAAMPLP